MRKKSKLQYFVLQYCILDNHHIQYLTVYDEQSFILFIIIFVVVLFVFYFIFCSNDCQ